jgi:hypothetical protein
MKALNKEISEETQLKFYLLTVLVLLYDSETWIMRTESRLESAEIIFFQSVKGFMRQE